MDIKNVLVVGAGTMGAGIAQLCAQKGLNAVISDVSQELADKGKARLEKGLAKRAAKGKITEEDKADVLSRIIEGTGFLRSCVGIEEDGDRIVSSEKDVGLQPDALCCPAGKQTNRKHDEKENRCG